MIVPAPQPVYGVCITPDRLPLLLQAPPNIAGPGTNVNASSHPIFTTGQVTVAGPAPDTFTVQVCDSGPPHASLPEYSTVIVPAPQPL